MSEEVKILSVDELTTLVNEVSDTQESMLLAIRKWDDAVQAARIAGMSLESDYTKKKAWVFPITSMSYEPHILFNLGEN